MVIKNWTYLDSEWKEEIFTIRFKYNQSKEVKTVDIDYEQRRVIVNFFSPLRNSDDQIYVFTGEDIFGEERPEDDLVPLLNRLNKRVTSVFYDPSWGLLKNSNIKSYLMEVNNNLLDFFLRLFTGPLFTYCVLLFCPKEVTIDALFNIITGSSNVKKLEISLLKKCYFITYPISDGLGLVFKTINPEIIDILNKRKASN